MRGREVGEGGDVDCGVQQHPLDLWELPSEHVGHHVQLGADGLAGGLREDRADGRRHHFS